MYAIWTTVHKLCVNTSKACGVNYKARAQNGWIKAREDTMMVGKEDVLKNGQIASKNYLISLWKGWKDENVKGT